MPTGCRSRRSPGNWRRSPRTSRSGGFSLDDLRGSTFTISNLGAVGGTYSTPIVNIPEVAILLVGRSRKLPVVMNDQIVARLMMPLSLSYDHRLVDGATAARFLNDVIAFLEAPSRLLLAAVRPQPQIIPSHGSAPRRCPDVLPWPTTSAHGRAAVRRLLARPNASAENVRNPEKL